MKARSRGRETLRALSCVSSGGVVGAEAPFGGGILNTLSRGRGETTLGASEIYQGEPNFFMGHFPKKRGGGEQSGIGDQTGQGRVARIVLEPRSTKVPSAEPRSSCSHCNMKNHIRALVSLTYFKYRRSLRKMSIVVFRLTEWKGPCAHQRLTSSVLHGLGEIGNSLEISGPPFTPGSPFFDHRPMYKLPPLSPSHGLWPF